MGAWGSGLYSSDIAADLRAAVKSVLRLPVGADEVVAALIEFEPVLANPADDDYPTCWLVVADQLHRYGVDHPSTFRRAVELVDADLATQRERGMSEGDVRRRAQALRKLSDMLSRRHPKPYRRTTLRSPQPLLYAPGELVRFPTKDGHSANPYFKSWAAQRPPFEPNGFGAALFIDAGHTFGFLAWYTTVMADTTWTRPPTVEDTLDQPVRRAGSGTLRANHAKRLAIELVSVLELSDIAVALRPSPRSTDAAAIADISLSNRLKSYRSHPPARLPDTVMRNLINATATSA